MNTNTNDNQVEQGQAEVLAATNETQSADFSCPNGAEGERRELEATDLGVETSERGRLVAVLEEYGVGVATFDGLRSDAYEKHLATRSSAELERFYAVLFDPGLSLAEMQRQCPGWQRKKESKGEAAGSLTDDSAAHSAAHSTGKPPSIETLRGIRQRIGAERTVNRLDEVEVF